MRDLTAFLASLVNIALARFTGQGAVSEKTQNSLHFEFIRGTPGLKSSTRRRWLNHIQQLSNTWITCRSMSLLRRRQ